jgi:hypothetical protein
MKFAIFQSTGLDRICSAWRSELKTAKNLTFPRGGNPEKLCNLEKVWKYRSSSPHSFCNQASSHPVDASKMSARLENDGYHRKAGQKGTQFLFVSSNLSRLKRVPKTILQFR